MTYSIPKYSWLLLRQTTHYHIGSAGASTVKLVVTSPNNLVGIAKFKVVCT
jgi:hypothetical protein